MLPDSIDNTNFRYVKVDNKYIISLNVRSLPEVLCFLDIINILDKVVEYDMSMYIEKLNPIKVLNNITYNLAYNQSELDTVNKSQNDFDIINKSKEEAKELRRKIQIENQELYSLNIIFTFYSEDLNLLFKIISSFKAKLFSKQIKSDVTNFRHLNFYVSNLPLSNCNLDSSIYITTDALANLFPFCVKNYIDSKGIFMGYTKSNNMIFSIDIFSKKYENSNFCIFGSSGSGKSFFTKLFIFRNFFMDRVQIVFDIENEYSQICKKLNGELLFDNSYFNIMQFFENDLKEEDFFNNKIGRLVFFIKSVCGEDMNEEILINEIKNVYYKFNINEDRKTILSNLEDVFYFEEKIMSKDKFPTLNDLVNNMKDSKEKNILKIAIKGPLKYFSSITSVNLHSKLFVLNISNLKLEDEVINLILKYILDRVLSEKETIIYIDEMWKYSKNEKVLDSIFNMYKTIRKRKGAIIGVTQDVTDFMQYKDGYYANSILNNSCFKMIFKTEYRNNKIFNEILNLDNDKVSRLKKGEGYLIINKNNIHLKVVANKYEGEILNEYDNSFK